MNWQQFLKTAAIQFASSVVKELEKNDSEAPKKRAPRKRKEKK